MLGMMKCMYKIGARPTAKALQAAAQFERIDVAEWILDEWDLGPFKIAATSIHSHRMFDLLFGREMMVINKQTATHAAHFGHTGAVKAAHELGIRATDHELGQVAGRGNLEFFEACDREVWDCYSVALKAIESGNQELAKHVVVRTKYMTADGAAVMATEYGMWDLARHFVNDNPDVIRHGYQDMIARQAVRKHRLDALQWVFSGQRIMTASLKQELIDLAGDNAEIVDWLCSHKRHHDRED